MPNASFHTALNAICPYYTMYPLAFPLSILQRHAVPGDWVLDPFCGRGTTNFAARLLELPTRGIDSSVVAVALAAAKVTSASASSVVAVARGILRSNREIPVPSGEFWRTAYHHDALRDLCRLRASLLRKCDSPQRVLLRAIILGALHGPLTKTTPSYFSNQCPRTFSPKPDYSVRFWKQRRMNPLPVDTMALIARRAHRFLEYSLPGIRAHIKHADSRSRHAYGRVRRFRFTITSPPYYGMRTYLPDQWLRVWFLGGPAEVNYGGAGQMDHGSPETFACQLAQVWDHVAKVSTDDARLVIRFGGISDRKTCPLALMRKSISHSNWRLVTVRSAGEAPAGRLQSDQFQLRKRAPVPEHDFYARLR